MAITVTELGAAIGLEIEGRRAADFLEPEVADDQLVALSRNLGEVLVVPNGAVEGHPEVAPVTRDRSKDAMAAYRKGTFFWHIDGSTDLVPNKATLLTAKEIADDGGDTEF